jgi:hypothetical protein
MASMALLLVRFRGHEEIANRGHTNTRVRVQAMPAISRQKKNAELNCCRKRFVRKSRLEAALCYLAGLVALFGGVLASGDAATLAARLTGGSLSGRPPKTATQNCSPAWLRACGGA